MADHTHHDIKPGRWYYTYNSLMYVHARLVKGQTGKVNERIPLPDGLDVVDGWNDPQLKKGPKRSGHNPSVHVKFSGQDAPMVSYVITTIWANVDKAQGTLFSYSTQQVTSRSVGNIMNIDALEESEWGNPKLWEYENVQIESLANTVVTTMKQKPNASQALASVIDANSRRSADLFVGLLNKMARDDASLGTASFSMENRFKDKAVFLAMLAGATGNYNQYSTFDARSMAFISQMVLKQGRVKYPDDVEKILDCYKKVQKARELEEVPFDYDTDYVHKLLLSKKRTKPADKAEVTSTPF